MSRFEPEITETVESSLKESGWTESKNIFGDCLVAPAEIRNRLIPAIARAVFNWAITSNQSRTFSLMETLAVSISGNANKIAGSIRAKLSLEEEEKAIPVIEESFDGVDIFVTLMAGGYVPTHSESADALDKAEKNLIQRLISFDYENQLVNE